jgi:hypothetical protein
MPLLKVGDRTLVLTETLGPPDILRFVGAVISDQGEGLDRNLSSAANDAVSQLGIGLLRILHAVDIVQFSSATSEAVSVCWQFDHMLSGFFESLANGAEKHVEVNLFELAWNNPPRLLQEFFDAASTAWETERREPLVAYFARNKEAWIELKNLLQDWQLWMQQDLSQDAKDFLLYSLRSAVQANQDQLILPGHLSSPALETWGTHWASFFSATMDDVLSGSNPETQDLIGADEMAHGLTLLHRTERWSSMNFWPVGNWVSVQPK